MKIHVSNLFQTLLIFLTQISKATSNRMLLKIFLRLPSNFFTKYIGILGCILGWMKKVEELIWPYCVHLYLTLWHQYIPCVFPIPLKTSNIRTQYVLGLIFDPIYISMWALERAIIYLQPGLKLGSYFMSFSLNQSVSLKSVV